MIILFKSYLRRLLVFSILIASIVALTNFFVDPGGVYQKYRWNASSQTPKDFVKIIVESNFGVFRPENLFNEREIVRELASFPQKYDCAIIGSSHVKQISLLRKNKSLSSLCSSTRNLGVSGASLEDYIAISNIILRNEFMPNKVFFGIDPWSLNFGRDKRYVQYKTEYLSMFNLINGSKNIDKDLSQNGFLSIILNLFNLEYFNRSLNMLMKPNSLSEYTEAPKFEFDRGQSYPVLLPDGSLVYSSKFIQDAANSIENLDGYNNYKIVEGSYYQDYAVDFFIKLVNHFQENQIEVFFLLLPYHHSVIDYKDQPITETLNKVDAKISELATILQVNVIGSYNPYDLECQKDEFYDESHPKDSCLAKLNNKVQ